MCRICGRVLKCVFESMPSRAQSTVQKGAFAKVHQRNLHSKHSRHSSSSKSLIRKALNLDNLSTSYLPPTFLLPFRAGLHQTAARRIGSASSQVSHTQPKLQEGIPLSGVPTSDLSISNDEVLEPSMTSRYPEFKPFVLSKSLQELLPILKAQKPHYITAHIHRFPYLLTAGDTVRLPFHMHGVQPGDILRLNRASLLGSRDYTLKAGTIRTESYDGKPSGKLNYIDERIFECRARVLGVDSGPMFEKEKTKRRNRKVKTVKSKHKFTVLKVMEVRIKDLEELNAENETLLLSTTD